MFHYDAGLFLTQAQMGVDVRRRQPRCFVSHAHTDHIARHELAFATAGTAALYRHRLGPRHRVQEMSYRKPIEFGGLRLTAFPAGHCLGSAMLLAEDGQRSLLYTGDFKLDASVTADTDMKLLILGQRRSGRVTARGYPRHGINLWPAPLSPAAT